MATAEPIRPDAPVRVPIKEHFERLIELLSDANQRHVDQIRDDLINRMEEGDTRIREHAATMFAEYNRAAELAEQEREKAAQIIREGLQAGIREGDERLREHIMMQVAQIAVALDSSEKLEQERIRALQSQIADLVERQSQFVQLIEVNRRFEATAATADERLNGLHREIQIINHASAEAIAKAEAATEKRFESVNEFRAQLNDQANRFVSREVMDAKFDEMRKQLGSNTDRLNVMGGQRQGSQAFQAGLMGVAVILVAAISIVANLLTR